MAGAMPERIGVADAGGVVGRILLVWVGLAAQTELAARVLPRLALAIPMETELGQLLVAAPPAKVVRAGRAVGKPHPNPLANHLGQPIRGGQLGVQQVQNLRQGQGAVLLPGCGVYGEAGVLTLGRIGRMGRIRLRRGLRFHLRFASAFNGFRRDKTARGVGVWVVLLSIADLLPSPFI